MLVGKKAPSFNADAVVNGGEFVENFSLEQYIGKKHVVFYFYPLDFTFVCPTEIIAFQRRIKDFEDRNVQVIGCSVDSKFSHWAWLNTPQNDGGIQGVKYPLVADINKTIALNYGVLAGHYDYTESGENTFVGNGGGDAVFSCLIFSRKEFGHFRRYQRSRVVLEGYADSRFSEF